MIEQFERLTDLEAELVYMAPVLISIKACWGSHELNTAGEEEAVKLAHFKTFTAIPLLLSYYQHVELSFNKRFAEERVRFTPFDDKKQEALLEQIGWLNKAISKLEKEYANALQQSLLGYADHVKKAGRGVVADFIFPVPITGLTD